MSIEIELRESIQSVATLKYPHIHESVRKVLNVIGAGDYITRLDEYNGKVYVTNEWSVRSCNQSEDYVIPLSIFQDDNPERAASIWRAQREVDEAESYVREKESSLRYANERLAKANVALETAQNGTEVVS